jgi:HAD superfamily hydrolase (TIGR01484 family)
MESVSTFMPNDSDFRPARPNEPFLLAADVDGTMLGDEDGESLLQAFARYYRRSFYLAYITGRYRTSVLRLVDEGRLPRPDYIFSNVGTVLFALDDPQNAIGRKYEAQVNSDWDLERIYTLGEADGIRRQEFSEGQPPFQAGFDWDGQLRSLAAFRQRLAHLHQHHILVSYNKYVDVLPEALGKGKATEFLQKELGLAREWVVVAGDSGNDCEMFETGFKGIVPVNALEELKAAASQPWHYHSPLPAAQGVLDGLRHFGFIEHGKQRL